MLFAISGSQGSGKSSVLRGLEHRGYKTMQRKISRSILADWNITLDEVNSSPEISLKFQDEILVRKLADEQEAMLSDEIFFTERTFMDAWTYYMYTFGSKSAFNEHINDYYDRCVQYDRHYTGVFLLPFGQFKVVADGVRNSNHLYAEAVDVVLRKFLSKNIKNLYEIQQRPINARVNYITKTVESFKK